MSELDKVASELAIVRLEKELKSIANEIEHEKPHPIQAVGFFLLSSVSFVVILWILINIRSFGFDHVSAEVIVVDIVFFFGLIAFTIFCIKNAFTHLSNGNETSLRKQRAKIERDLQKHRSIVANH